MKRPSFKELFNKIKYALELTSNGNFRFIDPVTLASDAIELGYQVKDIQTIFASVLNEINPGDYAGQRPPQRSYKVEIVDSELFAFSWKSKLFGCEAYVKFCFKNDCLYLVSLHCDRKGKGG
ncbi:MAG: hypothetical protein PVG39_21740 [Desulfobacteraceae bacterium]|jgi:hypothetical protein